MIDRYRYRYDKKNESMLFTQKCLELEMMLREISQVQKTKYFMFSFRCKI